MLLSKKILPRGMAREESSRTQPHTLLERTRSYHGQQSWITAIYRILVPPSLRKETLSKLHNGHQGIQRRRLRAKVSVWWPGIMREIENMISQCHTCARQFSPRKEPMIPTELPDYPWQRVGTDLFHLNGDNYLVVLEYFSRYPEIKKLSSTTSTAVIQTLKSIFSRLGIPQQVVIDNGPQFASQHFTNFAKSYI